MTTLASPTLPVAPSNFGDVVVDLATALPLGSWMWVAVAIAVLAVAAYATRQRSPIVTMDDLHEEARS